MPEGLHHFLNAAADICVEHIFSELVFQRKVFECRGAVVGRTNVVILDTDEQLEPGMFPALADMQQARKMTRHGTV